jgi:hypothetical protein
MDESNVWSPHLCADEAVLWQAHMMEQHYLAERGRQRKLGAVVTLASLIAAILFGVSLIDVLAAHPVGDSITPSLNRVLLLPIYIAAILACIAIAIGQVSRFNLKPPAAARYAVTNLRLLAASPDGALVDQMEIGDIAALELAGAKAPRTLTVRRKPGGAVRAPFAIAYVEHPAEAKTAIAEALHNPAPEAG